MVRPIILILGAIPVLAAIFIVAPQLGRQDVPSNVVTQEDTMTLQYTKEHLKMISFGVTRSIGADAAEVLTINNDGSASYSLTKNGNSQPTVKYQLSKDDLRRLKSIIKETGFMNIPSTDYPVKKGTTNYEKYGLQITFNGKTTDLKWVDRNDTTGFVPPIVTEVQSILDKTIGEIIK